MNLRTLRRTLGVPGLQPLLLVATLARVPVTAVAMTLTFQVVLGLHRGVGCQLADLRFPGEVSAAALESVGLPRSRWQGIRGPVRAKWPCSRKSRGVAVFVDQSTENVNSLYPRCGGVRLDQYQPGRRTGRL